MIIEITTSKHSSGALDQFLISAQSLSGRDLVGLIKHVLDAPGVYTFAELAELPRVQMLSQGDFRPYWDLLQIFSLGTYKDYMANRQRLPELSLAQRKKLQHLTIVTLSEQEKCIPYSILLEELGIFNLRELEDLIIEAIYSEIIEGKLDQRRALLEVDTTIGRDIKRDDVPVIISTLENWYDACEAVLISLQTQVDRANTEKVFRNQRKDALDQEIYNLKKSIKIQSQEVDDAYGLDSREALCLEKTPKKTPIKKSGGRGPGKLFK